MVIKPFFNKWLIAIPEGFFKDSEIFYFNLTLVNIQKCVSLCICQYVCICVCVCVYSHMIKHVNFGHMYIFYNISRLWTPSREHLDIIHLDSPFNIHYIVFHKIRTQKIFINMRTSVVVQWLRLWASTAAGTGSIPVQERSHIPRRGEAK